MAKLYEEHQQSLTDTDFYGPHVEVKGTAVSLHLFGDTIGTAVLTLQGSLDGLHWVDHENAPTLTTTNPMRRGVDVTGFRQIRMRTSTADSSASSDALVGMSFMHERLPELTTDADRRLLVDTVDPGSLGSLLYAAQLDSTNETDIIAPTSGVVEVSGMFVHNSDTSDQTGFTLKMGTDGSEVLAFQPKLGAKQTWDLVAVPVYVASGQTITITADDANQVNVIATGRTIS